MTSQNLLQHHILYNFDFCAFNTPSSLVASMILAFVFVLFVLIGVCWNDCVVIGEVL